MAAPILIAGALGALGPALAGAGLTAIIGGFVISAALSGLSMLLQSKPPTPQAQAGGGFPSSDPGSKVTGNQADTPRQIVYGRTRVNGTVIFQSTTSKNAILLLVVALADHESESVDEVWFGSEKVWTAAGGVVSSKFSGKADIAAYLGTATQEADSYLTSAVPDQWTGAHRLLGVTYVRLALTWNREAFAGFSPQSVWAVVKGKKVYDPRDLSTAWSNNPALCVADYLASARHGLGSPYGTEIDTTALSAAASICDEDEVGVAGATEPRYTLNGTIRLDQKPIDVIAGMLSAMAGRCVWSGGQWRIGAAAWSAPVLSFDENDLRGGFTVQNLLGRRNSFNSAKGVYVNPSKQWQSDSFPSVVIDDYVDQDDGEQAWKDNQLPFTDSPTMAQRIVTIDLHRGRQPLSMTLPLNLKGWGATVGENVSINNTRLGWSAKAFEVVNVKLAFDDNGLAIGVDLDLRETAAAVFETGTIDTANDPAPNTNLPDYFNVLPVSNVRLTEALYSTRDGGGVKNKGTVRWDESPDKFVQSGGRYIPQYRLVGAAEWITLQTVPGEADTFAEIADLAAGTYESQVIAVNWLGGRSDPVGTAPTSIAGLAAAPAAPTSFAVNASGGLAIARWAVSPELDVLQGGYILFRHSALLTGATWADGVSIADPQPGALSVAVLPLKAGTYMAKFLDSTGNPSASFASFVQSQASVLSFSTLTSSVQDPTFGGAKTSMLVDSAVLELDAAGSFDSVPSVDALPSWDWYGGVVASGSYAFASKVDLATVRKCRATSAITSLVVNVFDDFDSRTDECDDWSSWDGSIRGEEADAVLMVRSTSDDPASGAAAWSGWQRLDSADFNARGFDLRLDAVSFDTSFTIKISALAVVFEGI